MNVLAIIPARGGSKGIQMKNIQKLAGKPLIEYPISSAKESSLIDKIIVSTDNQKIAKVARKAGAEVPFLRPKRISGDNATVLDLVNHAVNFLNSKSYNPEIIVYLQPTSPLRPANVIDHSIKLLKKSKASCIIAVMKVKTHPFTSFWLKNNNLEPFKKDFQKINRRQKKPEILHPTGVVYTFWRKNLTNYNSIYGPKIKPIIIHDPKYNIDIDEEFDLFLTEMAIKNWEKYDKNFKKRRIA